MEYLASQMTRDMFRFVIQSFPHSWLITEFVTRLIQQVALEEQELQILPEHSPPLFTCLRGVHVVHAVKLHVITFLVPCHDVRCNFSMQYLKKKKIK
jgi:hypothetical protein